MTRVIVMRYKGMELYDNDDLWTGYEMVCVCPACIRSEHTMSTPAWLKFMWVVINEQTSAPASEENKT
jgi:hypothetical protein